MELPLAGKRVLVTRAQHQAGKLSEGLRQLGAVPVEVPVLEIAPPVSFEPLDQALQQIKSFHWVLFTSANAVQAVSERFAVLAVPEDDISAVPVAAVGSATAAAAREKGLNVVVVPESYVAEGLLAAINSQELTGKRILLARAEVARDVIPEALRERGATVDVVDAYRNRIPEGTAARLREALTEGLDAATFTSSSSVTHLRACAEAAGLRWPLGDIPAVSIGPITSETLRNSGWTPAAEASSSDVPGLVEAVRTWFTALG